MASLVQLGREHVQPGYLLGGGAAPAGVLGLLFPSVLVHIDKGASRYLVKGGHTFLTHEGALLAADPVAL
jgi:hypothetical protein